MAILKGKEVDYGPQVAALFIRYKHYGLGIEINTWGFRAMLIWWHWCFHWPWYRFERQLKKDIQEDNKRILKIVEFWRKFNQKSDGKT